MHAEDTAAASKLYIDRAVGPWLSRLHVPPMACTAHSCLFRGIEGGRAIFSETGVLRQELRQRMLPGFLYCICCPVQVQEDFTYGLSLDLARMRAADRVSV
jgi:hypothetical protein